MCVKKWWDNIVKSSMTHCKFLVGFTFYIREREKKTVNYVKPAANSILNNKKMINSRATLN